MVRRISSHSQRTAILVALIAFSFPVVSAGAAPAIIKVVAAENFYGNIVAQLGGEKVSVTSILSDPNVDPHEYESSVEDAKAIALADLVIENSGGYDDWMDKLLSASTSARRVLIKGFDIAPTKLPDNEHVWYNVDNVQAIAQAVTDSLKKLDPADAVLFSQRICSHLGSPSRAYGKNPATQSEMERYSRWADGDDLPLPGQANRAVSPYALRVSESHRRRQRSSR